ncbi:hypothetical protein CLLI_06210 [Clostridium liquoris]|jgi:transcriptional regulator with XRE-family HTH domain|uniref:HTH cro/C1-type domain-containing protein n=1 Tax=Clostridium liquoris TaxID=1289519 RepID=A0A2T0B7L3_9CLOT|nr:helix-turn-helix transcriptional regulator [Clostridium liquoris]PRR79888.1 hypothetical protein CLLI_06210 [Clostridium liquoris]
MIAENLKRLRLERNLSLGQLAELFDVSKVMISQIKKGDINPTINTIWKIAKKLNVPYTVQIDKHKNSTYIIKNLMLKNKSAKMEPIMFAAIMATSLTEILNYFCSRWILRQSMLLLVIPKNHRSILLF